MVQNMISLRENLTAYNIKWEDRSDDIIDRTFFIIDGHSFYVVNGFATKGGYGNRTYYFNHEPSARPKNVHELAVNNLGQLELHIDSTRPIGYLSCTQVLQILNLLVDVNFDV